MIGIAVTAEAYAAIKATLPADTQTWPTNPADEATLMRASRTSGARCRSLAFIDGATRLFVLDGRP